MPIKIPANLPAHAVLSAEGVMVMDPSHADRQDIRPLRIALLNLMPLKIQTENQFARLIGATPLQIELTLLRMTSHQTKNTSSDHMEQFYKSFSAVRDEKFDGLIITGAPIEHLDFQDVTYWPEMVEVMNWTQSHVHATLGVCWGGMAMINYLHGVKKYELPQKAFGCFRHQNLDPSSPFLRGFSDDFVVPVSRWTEIKQDEISAAPGLKTLLGSSETGPCLVEDPAHRTLYLFNHFEYDSNTLKQEYDRDIANGTPINIPDTIIPGMIPAKLPSTAGAHMPIFSMATGSMKSTKRRRLIAMK
jgi:homoserine O-succinyltransferase